MDCRPDFEITAAHQYAIFRAQHSRPGERIAFVSQNDYFRAEFDKNRAQLGSAKHRAWLLADLSGLEALKDDYLRQHRIRSYTVKDLLCVLENAAQ